MKSINRILSSVLAASLTLSCMGGLTALASGDEWTTLWTQDFEGLTAGVILSGPTTADAPSSAAIDDNLSYVFNAGTANGDANTYGGVATADDNNYAILIQKGSTSQSADQQASLTITDDDFDLTNEGDEKHSIKLEFDAFLTDSGTAARTAVIMVDGIVLGSDYGSVANEWQHYTITLTPYEKSMIVDIDGTVTKIEDCDATAISVLKNGNSGARNLGTIYIDNMVASKCTIDTSPEALLGKYVSELTIPSSANADIALTGGNSNYAVTWTTSNSSLIKLEEDGDNYIGEIYPQQNDLVVTLTAKVQAYYDKNEEGDYISATKSFNVTVNGIGDLSAELEALDDQVEFKQPSEDEYTVISDNFTLPYYEEGYIVTEWTSDNDLIKVIGDTAAVQPPVRKDTLVTLTAKVYCSRNESISQTKSYTVLVEEGAFNSDIYYQEVFMDEDFESDTSATASIGTTAITYTFSSGKASLAAGVRTSGADGATYATVMAETDEFEVVTNHYLDITNGNFASSDRNAYITFTNVGSTSEIAADEMLVMDFRFCMVVGSSGEPSLVLNDGAFTYSASDMGVEYGTWYDARFIIDPQNNKMILVVDGGNIVVSALSGATAFTQLEVSSASYNGSIYFDDIKIRSAVDFVSLVTFQTVPAISGASVEIPAAGLVATTGEYGSATFFLPKGEYDVTAVASGYDTAYLTVQLSGTDVTYNLEMPEKIPSERIDAFMESICVESAVEGVDVTYNSQTDTYTVSDDIQIGTNVDSDIFKVTFTQTTEGTTYIANDGVVSPHLTDDIDVQLEVSVVAKKDRTVTGTKVLNVKVKNVQTALASAKASLIAGGIYYKNEPYDGSKAVSEDVVLPVLLSDKYTVTWESSNPELLTANGEVIGATDTETDVKLTATITYVKGGASVTADFTVTLAPKSTYADKLEEAINEITAAASFTSVDTDAVINIARYTDEDFYVPTTSTVDDAITFDWSSSSETLVLSKTESGKAYMQFVPIYVDSVTNSNKGINVTLTMTAKYGDIISDTKTFTVPVVLQDDTLGKYRVRGDMLYEGNFDVTYNKNTKNMSELKSVTKDITDLQTEGIFGSSIVWESSNSKMKISNNKINVTQGSSDTVVTITANVKADNYKDANTYKICVDGTGESGGGNGSGSGSGTSSTNITLLVPDTTIVETDTQGQFTDLGTVAWAEEAINYLAQAGIVNGKSNGIFAPNDNITRAETVQILTAALGMLATDAECDMFSDASATDWYYRAVASAYNNGIASGYDNGTFGVNDNITRQDLAVMVYNAMLKAGGNLAAIRSVGFADADQVSGYAQTAVQSLADAGVINGMTESTFAPLENATRAQVAVMIYNIIK